MSYADFAQAWSVVLVAIYTALVVITLIRASLPVSRTEVIRVHARYIEGPAVTMLLIVAVILWVSASSFDHEQWDLILRYVGAAIRGVLMALGGWLIAYYWTTRRTWLP